MGEGSEGIGYSAGVNFTVSGEKRFERQNGFWLRARMTGLPRLARRRRDDRHLHVPEPPPGKSRGISPGAKSCLSAHAD